MKLVTAIALPTLCLLPGCSDPPADPARAAVAITVNPNGTGACVPVAGLTEIPGDRLDGTVSQAVNCDPTQAGCDPTAAMAEDGKSGASVSCSVKPGGAGYVLSLSAKWPARAPGEGLDFTGSGSVSGPGTSTGFRIGSTNRTLTIPKTASDSACELTVKSVEAGAILATFDCPTFDEAGITHPPGCRATGGFIFDRCSD